MSYYQRQIFFCTNQRDNGRKCCQDGGATAHMKHAKAILVEAGLHGPGLIRVNKAGCMGRCQQGPALVIYPDGVWCTYKSNQDIEAIVAAAANFESDLKSELSQYLMVEPLATS